MQILSGIIFLIIALPILPAKFLASLDIFSKYIKNTEWAVEPVNVVGSIILFILFVIEGLIFYLIIRAIIMAVRRFIRMIYKFINREDNRG